MANSLRDLVSHPRLTERAKLMLVEILRLKGRPRNPVELATALGMPIDPALRTIGELREKDILKRAQGRGDSAPVELIDGSPWLRALENMGGAEIHDEAGRGNRSVTSRPTTIPPADYTPDEKAVRFESTILMLGEALKKKQIPKALAPEVKAFVERHKAAMKHDAKGFDYVTFEGEEADLRAKVGALVAKEPAPPDDEKEAAETEGGSA